MLASGIPRKFNLPFAQNATSSFINFPIPDTPPGTAGLASLSTGFPPINFTPISAGGIPPAGADFNALLFQITSWNQWQAAGGSIPHDPTFATSIGGYPNGAIVGSKVVPGNFWQSTVDGNTSDPDAGGANWITPPSMKGTGDWAFRPVSDPLPNHIIQNGTTIGNAASGATQLASATALFAYQHLWNKFSNTLCPVTGGRGANATADFNAGKPIATINMQSSGIMGVDGMGGTPTGLLNGVPVQLGSVTVPASVVGENLHTLIIAELAVHSHVVSDPTHLHGNIPVIANKATTDTQGNQAVLPSPTGVTSANVTSIANVNTGSSSPHNTVARNMLGYWFLHI